MSNSIFTHVEPEELRRLGREQTNGRVASRMFAIANVLNGLSREDAATHARMERQSLRDWVHRFNAEGVEGLRDRPHKGRPGRMIYAMSVLIVIPNNLYT